MILSLEIFIHGSTTYFLERKRDEAVDGILNEDVSS